MNIFVNIAVAQFVVTMAGSKNNAAKRHHEVAAVGIRVSIQTIRLV